MKRFTSFLLIAAALVLTPTGAFAKDKHKHKNSSNYYDNRQCGSQVYYGRTYVAPQYYSAPNYCAPRYVAPSYYAPSYYRGYSSGYCAPQRSSGVSFYFGF